ncbi:MAG: MFS transporter, partial [Hyphomicrobiaceae bacterium]|nr:MFS transporter [Hyphomicrobiaceae bacterium]
MLAMALWFVTAALLPELAREFALVPGQQALLSSAVQIGFVAGALTFAISGLPDRFDPRRVLAISATLAAAANCLQLMLDPGGIAAVIARFAVGFLLAGVYPVGMKIVVGWGIRDRGLLVGIVVGALTFGTAMPFVFSWIGQADWRSVVLVSSSLAAAGALLVLLVQLGPHH